MSLTNDSFRLGFPSGKTPMTSEAEFAGSGLYTSLPSHCLTASGSLPPFKWLCKKSPSRNLVDWHAQHVAKPAQPMQCDQFIYRGYSLEPELDRVLNTPNKLSIRDAEAFDPVQHLTLLHKLESYGIQGEILRCTRAFLSDRTFPMKVGSIHSSPALDSTGVSQGSVYEPLSCLIHVNDLPDIISSLPFADDLESRVSNSIALQVGVDATR
ncbi:hypothetical protein T265_07154 [Opisthorchis viverrini]|uniref:Uncharacterized protein n=1 Tax=Opisthorchis viverrini TaxID=6198 RepID=A0A074ZHV8_OPIVI|nr:hypothetical protein T265_07154 [Opisthorchis viverrini]KER25352.1 hypothetical protein T265_07154 [Opisthorchis viverrini]